MAYDGVNLGAAVVGAILAFGLGALWYSPALFSRAWLAAVGKTEAEVRASPQAIPLLLSLGAWLVAALALAYILARIPLDSAADGLLVAAAAWLLPGSMSLMNNTFEGRPSALWMINAGYTLAGFLLIGATLVFWPF